MNDQEVLSFFQTSLDFTIINIGLKPINYVLADVFIVMVYVTTYVIIDVSILSEISKRFKYFFKYVIHYSSLIGLSTKTKAY